jgi:hypothetical protein
VLNTLSGVLFFVAFLPYCYSIVNNPLAAPSPVTWTIWACVDTLALAAMVKEKSHNGQIIGATIGAWLVTSLAIVYGTPTMGSMEWVSIAGAAAGIILWQKTGSAVFAIICSQAAVLVGAIPTFAKGYYNPASEDPLAWALWFCSCICTLLALEKWDIEHALQPITFTIIETIMVFLVIIRPNL